MPMRSMTLVLALAAVIAEVAITTEAGSRKLAATVSPCLYNENGGYGAWTGNCGLNPAWVATQTPFSPIAKADALALQASEACAKHDVSSGKAADYAACAADKANWCYITGKPGSFSCYSNGPNSAFVKVGVPCKGTLYEQYSICQSTLESDCKGNCVWRADLANPNFKAGRAAVGPAYEPYYLCIPLALNATFANTTIFNNPSNIFSPSDPAMYAKVRGTCDYAKQGFKRFAYDKVCRAGFNTPVGGVMMGTGNVYSGKFKFTGIDASLATKCYLAGCDLSYIPGNVNWGYGADFYSCDTNPNIRYALGYYDVVKDATLLQAVRVCSDHTLLYNQTLCNAATL